MALARAQLATQSPQPPDPNLVPVPSQSARPREALVLPAVAAAPAAVLAAPFRKDEAGRDATGQSISAVQPGAVVQTSNSAPTNDASATGVVPAGAVSDAGTPQFPANWPDPRGFIPPPPSPQRPPYIPSNEPVLRHARFYSGNDADFTTALENYHYSRDDARKDGWQGTLQRSDEFIRFCCYKHIAEMLTARGGGGESQVLYRWETGR